MKENNDLGLFEFVMLTIFILFSYQAGYSKGVKVTKARLSSQKVFFSPEENTKVFFTVGENRN